MSTPSFYLTQRLKHRDGEGYNFFGGDRQVSETLNSTVYPDYMGGAQYEYALPQSAERMAASSAAGRLAVVQHELEYAGGAVVLKLGPNPTPADEALHRISKANFKSNLRTVSAFFVVDKLEQDMVLSAWDEWMKQGARTGEPTMFIEELHRPEGQVREIVGWWALGADSIWTLEEDRAADIKTAFDKVTNAAV